MAAQIQTEIIIDAPPAQVWQVLLDQAAYPEWNPFVTSVEGEFTPGATPTIKLQPPGGKVMTMRPRVLVVEPDRELRWLGSLGIRGLFDGEHIFELEPTGDGRTRFVHSERFSGILAPIIFKMIGDQTTQGFEALNQALKNRVEAMPTTGQQQAHTALAA